MQISELNNKRILLSPLNWGFGHVSRCIGLIDILLQNQNTVFVACDEAQKHIFLEYFGDKISFIHHEGYPFKFKGKGNFGSDLLMSFSVLRRRLLIEKCEVEEHVVNNQIDCIIADHRYGFYSKKVPSIILTHQINLPLKWYEWPVQLLHKKYLKEFNFIWVPDYSDSRLSGKLSWKNGYKNVLYIGPLSRFSRYDVDKTSTIHEKVLIASGPDIYAQQLVDQFGSNSFTVIASKNVIVPENCKRVEGSWLIQDQVIINAESIVSRSGYSTIMDLEFLKLPAELVPTKGQAEQEYLKSIHM